MRPRTVCRHLPVPYTSSNGIRFPVMRDIVNQSEIEVCVHVALDRFFAVSLNGFDPDPFDSSQSNFKFQTEETLHQIFTSISRALLLAKTKRTPTERGTPLQSDPGSVRLARDEHNRLKVVNITRLSFMPEQLEEALSNMAAIGKDLVVERC